MCGIFGKVSLNGAPLDPVLIQRQNNVMRHRGPDGAGYLFTDGAFRKTHLLREDRPVQEQGLPEFSIHTAIAHRRLSIIDLAGGSQPMPNENQRVWTSFNGEIYNYAELRKELLGRGHRFRTDHSDTEVIVHAWEEWGPAMLQRFIGMFALALLDLDRRQLFLARDRLGIKPLYYYQDTQCFTFASELKAILEDPAVPRTLEQGALSDYFAYGYIPAPKSIIRNSRKLQAAHHLLLDLTPDCPVAQPERYWDVTFEPTPRSWEDGLEEFDSLLRRSVKYRCIADVPLGGFLSGGLDSSTIVHYMKLVNDSPPLTFSIGVEDHEQNEAAAAKELATLWGTRHKEFYVTPRAREVLPVLARQMDEPFADASMVPTHYLCEMASKHVTVALSGDGGDELFGGYNLYHRHLMMNKYVDRIPSFMRRHLLGIGVRLLPVGIRRGGFFQGIPVRFEERPEASCNFFNTALQARYFFRDSPFPRRDYLSEVCDRRPETDPLSRLQRLDLECYMAEDILMKVDRMSMLHSLEVRVPMLDHNIVEWAAKVPHRFKIQNGSRKVVIRRLMEKHLPKDYLSRRKMGFSVPVRNWVADPLRTHVEETLLSPDSFVREHVSQELIKALIHQNGRRYHDPSLKLWNLLLFEEWAGQYLGSQAPGVRDWSAAAPAQAAASTYLS